MPYTPTRRLALVVALLAPVWLLSGSTAGLAVAIAATLLVAIAAGADVVRAPVGGAAILERALPGTIGLGDPIVGAYVVRPGWARAFRVRVHDRLPAAVERTSPLEWVAVPAFGEATVPLHVVGRTRGAWPLGAAVVRVAGPWGLVDRFVRAPLDDAVTVAPSVAGVRRYRLLALQHRLRDAGVRQLRRRGEGTTFASLREYAVGDEPRHIDWKASARRGRTMVREYTVEQGQTVIVAIDAGRLMTQLSDGVPRFEHALTAALVLADVAVHSGDQVGLLLFDDEVRAWVPPARGRPALERLRETLVDARATMTEPDYAAAFRTLATRHRKRSLLVLFTDAIDARASQALVAHTARGAARHLPLVVALRNDALVEAARPRADAKASALYEAAAAEELLLARDEALQRMRAAGASVVDVSPRTLAAAVVNRYLELKGRGAV